MKQNGTKKIFNDKQTANKAPMMFLNFKVLRQK